MRWSLARVRAVNVHRLFWFGLFLPVNVLLQALCFAFWTFRPDLDSAVFVIVLLKAAYFLMALYGIFALKIVWRSVAGMSSQGAAWTYRAVGLATVGALLAVHAEHAYQFGRTEREIRRNMISTNKTLPSAPQPGVRIDQVRLERRDWVYESTMTQLQVSQIDRGKFIAAARHALDGTTCAVEWHRRLFGFGVRIRYVYRDRYGDIIADEAFGTDSCSGRL